MRHSREYIDRMNDQAERPLDPPDYPVPDPNLVQEAAEHVAYDEAIGRSNLFIDYIVESAPSQVAEIISRLIAGSGPDRIIAKMMADKLCADWKIFRVNAMDEMEMDAIEREVLEGRR